MEEEAKSNFSILYLGDVHLYEIKSSVISRCELFGNEHFKGDDYFETGNHLSRIDETIKTLRETYNTFKKDKKIVPKIIIFHGGSFDVARVATIDVVLTNIFRLVRTFKKDGVLAIVICALVPRNIPPPFNEKIKKINISLSKKCQRVKGLYYVSYEEPAFTKDDYKKGNIILKEEIYKKFWTSIKPVMREVQLDMMLDELMNLMVSFG